MYDNTKVTPRSSGDIKACRVIFGKARKADVIALAVELSDSEIEAATKAFLKQGPRLWGFWCAGLKAREKAQTHTNP